jgi:hypothetical protein
MGKRSRQKRLRRGETERSLSSDPAASEAWPAQADAVAWDGGDGLHMLVPGQAPSVEQLEGMTQVYERKIRQSPLWHEMVRQFGVAQAEEMLRDFRVELR